MSPLENGRNRKRFAGLRRYLRETSARTWVKTRRRRSSNSLEVTWTLTGVTKRVSEIEKGQKHKSAKLPDKISRCGTSGVSRLFIWVLWSETWIFKADCGSCDLIKGSLRIKAIRKAFVEAVQLFRPPTSPPTTLEHQSLHTPTWITSTWRGDPFKCIGICHLELFWVKITLNTAAALRNFFLLVIPHQLPALFQASMTLHFQLTVIKD